MEGPNPVELFFQFLLNQRCKARDMINDIQKRLKDYDVEQKVAEVSSMIFK